MLQKLRRRFLGNLSKVGGLVLVLVELVQLFIVEDEKPIFDVPYTSKEVLSTSSKFFRDTQ